MMSFIVDPRDVRRLETEAPHQKYPDEIRCEVVIGARRYKHASKLSPYVSYIWLRSSNTSSAFCKGHPATMYIREHGLRQALLTEKRPTRIQYMNSALTQNGLALTLRAVAPVEAAILLSNGRTQLRTQRNLLSSTDNIGAEAGLRSMPTPASFTALH